jgi:hypothetical protein
MGSVMPGAGEINPPWSAIVAGLDGSIYIEMNANPRPPLLAQILNNNGGANTNEIVVFKYVPQSSAWDLEKIPVSLYYSDSRIYTEPRVPFYTSQLVAVDNSGRYYAFVSASENYGLPETTITRITPDLNEAVHVTSRDLRDYGFLSGITTSGQILVRVRDKSGKFIAHKWR